MHTSRICQIVALFLSGLLVFNGCKSKQKIIYSTSPVENKAHSQLFSDILRSEFPYETFSAKLNIGISSGTKSFNSKANLRIEKDHALQISIQPLFGVEMFRVYMNPDTVLLLDRMNRRYVLESIAEIKKHYPVGFDYYTLQSLFTNSVFVSGKEHAGASDYDLFRYERSSDQCYRLTATDSSSRIDYSFVVNGDDRITYTHLMHPEKKHFMQWGYQDFVYQNSVTFPHKMLVTLSSASRKAEAEIQLYDVQTNPSFQLSLNIPSGYTRTSLNEIMKMLSTKK